MIRGHHLEGLPIVSIDAIDESGFAHDMPHTHGYAWVGYAPVGQRHYGRQDWHGRGWTNAIGALIGKALLRVGLFKTNVKADVFTPWIKQDLRPKLPETALLVMDNATCHKRSDTLKAIQEAGHKALFLPPYSPDL